MESTEAARPRRRLRRVIAIAAGSVAMAVALVLFAAVLLLHDLARPWLKPRLLARIDSASGMQLDYRAARIDVLSGLHLEGLVVRTPGKLQKVAPELLRVGSVDARWSLRALLGHGIKIEQVSVRDLAVTLVADDAAPPPAEVSAAKPSPGLSRQLAALLQTAPPIGQLEVSGLALSYLTVKSGAVVDRFSLRGLAAEVKAEPDGHTWKLALNVGQPASPLRLELSREGKLGAGSAALDLALAAELTDWSGHARVDLDVSQQSFDPRVHVQKLLHGAVDADIDVAHQRIAIALGDTRLADAATLSGSLVLPDATDAPPQLGSATADVDFARLLQLVPADLVPFTLDSGKAQLRARNVSLGAIPQLGSDGELALDGSVSGLARDGIALGSAKVSVVATPDPKGGLAGRATFALEALTLAGKTPVQISKAHGTLLASRLRPEATSPLRASGEARLSGEVESLVARAGGLRIEAEHAGFNLDAPLPKKAPFALRADLPIGALRIFKGQNAPALDGPAHLVLDAQKIDPDVVEPRRSRAKATLAVDVAGAHVSLDATKGAEDLVYALDLQAPSLASLRPFLPRSLAGRAPWERMGVTLGSSGSLAGMFSRAPHLEHHTELHLVHPGWDEVRAESAALVLSSKGDAWKHQGSLDVQAEGLRLGKTEAGAEHLALTFDLDRRRPALSLKLVTRKGPKVSLDASLAYDRARRALDCDLKATASELATAAPLLALAGLTPALETSRLGLAAELHGAFVGVLAGVGPEGAPKLAPELLRNGGFEGTASLDASNLRWREDAQALSVPSLSWRAELHADGPKRTVHSVLTVDALKLNLSGRRVSIQGLADDATASFTGVPAQSELAVTQRLSVHTLEQDPVVPYPIQDLSLSFSARREPSGVIHVSDLQLSNPAAKTTLQLKGRLDLSNARRHLAVRGSLTQDLSTIGAPEAFEGSGSVAMNFKVASPDLTVFRTRVDLGCSGVHVHLPASGVKVDGFDGQVPLTENLELRHGKLRLLRDSDVNLYSMLRFADQHPLLRRSGYVSVASITTPYVSIAPLAGNMSVNQNIFSMSQLEMGVRNGRITGQCVLDWQGMRSTFQADIRATGVQSSHGEPFDGNAAVVVSAKDRSIDGRAEILRIGNRHLLDLLDLQDPNHIDPSMNRVRRTLALGYPDHVRVVFDHGFASAQITFGGLAKLFSLDAIRGIPMGPLVDRAIETLSKSQEEP